MSNLYKCSNCDWTGSSNEMVDTYSNYTDDWDRDCEEGFFYSCPNCGNSFTLPWSLYELDPIYKVTD